ncbi:MAG: dihydrolipoamide acyltransferase [Bacteroidales bacterium]|nr:dihydrolipoamide acyltransferase [Bacteroidales bacterium]
MKTFTQKLVVDKKHTALELGSGNLDVFATPAMIAMMENTALKAIDDLKSGFSTVGIEINVKHLKASKIGEEVTCIAILTKHEKKLYEFEITVTDSTGDVIGSATHKRVAVEIEKFMKR